MEGTVREGLFKTGSWVMKLAGPEKSCPDRTGCHSGGMGGRAVWPESIRLGGRAGSPPLATPL